MIFCRNVLIYFDVPTKRSVLDRLYHSLGEGGYLVLGAAETVVGLTEQFVPHPQYPGLIQRRSGGTRGRVPLKLVAG